MLAPPRRTNNPRAHNPPVDPIQRIADTTKGIADTTKGTPWEGRLFLVGGSVRDPLLGLPIIDEFDIVVDGDALDLVSLLHEKGITSIHPVTYPRFGTALARVDECNVEFASARRESYSEQSRKPKVEPATLKEDAIRRDFTVNALMRNIHTGELLDLTGSGLQDLEHRILRTPLDPSETFRDDPLRMLRAVRFKNRLGFQFAPGLAEAIRSEKERLSIVSAERIRDELTKMLLHSSAAQSLEDLMSLGLLSIFAPEFQDCVGVEQGAYHDKDVWGHTLDVVSMAARGDYSNDDERLLVVLTALFHDIGKPRTASVDADGRTRFFGHDKVGSQMAHEILTRVRFPKRTIGAVAKLVANHMRLGSAPKITKSAARRLLRDMGELTEPLLKLCEADAAAIGRTPKPIPFQQIRQALGDVGQEARRTASHLDSPLNGNEIILELGIEPGPEVAHWKNLLTEAVLEGEVPPGDKEAAKRFLHSNFERQKSRKV